MLKILIIDDEVLSREAIRSIVRNYCHDAVVIGEATGVMEGVLAIEKYTPDIVLLDIKLGDGSGFDLLERIKSSNAVVIFITAYVEFAIKAFKTSAIDYLLKPIDIEELKLAISKAKIQKDKSLFEAQLNILLANFHHGGDHSKQQKNKIVIKTSTEIRVLDPNEVLYLSADGNYTKFYLTNKTTLIVSKTLKDYDEQLAEHNFLRIHQSHIVNMMYVSKFDKKSGGRLVLKDTTTLGVSTRRKEALVQFLENM